MNLIVSCGAPNVQFILPPKIKLIFSVIRPVLLRLIALLVLEIFIKLGIASLL